METPAVTERYIVSPKELLLLHRCLSSKVCLRIFKTLQRTPALNITALALNSRCNNRDALRHLSNLCELNIVRERHYSRRRTFILERNELMDLIKKTVEVIESEKAEA